MLEQTSQPEDLQQTKEVPHDGEGPISATATMATPGGATFDMLRGNDADPNMTGRVLDEAIAYCEENDVVAARCLKGHASFEYKMADAINHASSKEVKATLLRLLVTLRVAQHDHDGAVHMLSYAKAAKLDLPQYNMEFLNQQYEAEVAGGDYTDAWHIARTVLTDRNRMTKSSASLDVWRKRKDEMYGKMLADLVAVCQAAGQIDRGLHIKLELMFMRIEGETQRSFGEGPHADLQRQIAELMIGIYLQKGDKSTADWYARKAGFVLDEFNHLKPEPKFKQLMKKIARLWGPII